MMPSAQQYCTRTYGGVIISIILLFITPLFVAGQSSNDIERINSLAGASQADLSTFQKIKHIAESRLNNSDSLKQDLAVVKHAALQIERLGDRLHYPSAKGLSKLLQAKMLRASGHADLGRKTSDEAVRLLAESKNPEWKAEAYIELGGSYSNEAGDLPEKIRLYRQAADIYHIIGRKESEAGIKEFVGDLLQLNKQFTESIQVLQEALTLYQQTGNERIHGVYSLLGRAYQGASQFIESLRYNLLAIEVGEKLNDRSPLMVAIYNRVGLNYSAVKYFDQSLGYFKKAITLARENGDTYSVKTILLNIASDLSSSGRYRESLDSLASLKKYGELESETGRIELETIYILNYNKLQQPAKGKPNFDKLQQYYQSGKMSRSGQQLIRLASISYLQGNGEFKRTQDYFRDYYRDLDSSSIPLAKKNNAELAAYRTDSALNDLPAAIAHLKRHKLLSDSFTNNSLKRQMGIMQIQYETEQKDKNIELLTQKSKLQDASLQQQKIYRNVFIGGVCMLIIFLGLLYNRYRLKQIASARLETKQAEINRQNGELKRLLDDKEWLLKEIHHRVKNNLQIVISLLNTQSKFLDNNDAIEAIRNSQHRMFAMSLIHQRLYQTDNLGNIEMSWYITELVQYLQESFYADRIRFSVECDKVTLDVVQAVPLGLILNEAVSNSIKYAFPDDRKGQISVSLKHLQDAVYQLQITDNGIGLPKGMLPEESTSLGMSLMTGLTAQLSSELVIDSDGTGVKISVQFERRDLSTNEIEITQA